MNRIDAHEILYAAEAGCEVFSIEITEALYATGDLGCAREPEPQAVEASREFPYYTTAA